MAILKTLTVNGVTYSVTPVVPASSVTLLASAWEGDGDSYSQMVEIPGVTTHTKVDLQPTSDQLVEFHNKVLGFVAENDGGRVTVYAIGDRPTDDHTIQITRTEVEGTGKIRGNTVGTTMPRPDWNQTDPKKADYIRNKPNPVEINDTAVGGDAWSSKNIVDKLCPTFTESGAVVVCEPVEGYPLEVVSGIEPYQSGTGEPSPDNIRDISGGSSIMVFHECDIESRQLIADFGQTVYGGSFNWGTGELVSNMVCLTFTGDEDWTVLGGGSNIAYAFLSIGARGYVDDTAPQVSSHFMMYTITSSTENIGFDAANSIPYNDARVRFRMKKGLKLDEWIAFLKEQYANGTPVQVCFGVSNPTTVKLAAQEILALPGVNTLYADNGNVTVTCKSYPGAAIEKLTNAILSLGGNV